MNKISFYKFFMVHYDYLIDHNISWLFIFFFFYLFIYFFFGGGGGGGGGEGGVWWTNHHIFSCDYNDSLSNIAFDEILFLPH